MAKPIKLTEDLKQRAIDEFIKSLSGFKMADGKISYNKNFVYKSDEKAEILLTPLAYTKMISLVLSFDSEVAWYGVGERVRGAKFLITDILVYPQTVTGSTVELDTEEYTKWLIKNDADDRFDHIVMQGHSHVSFGTTPSGTDLNHQEEILSRMKENSFYIFLIWNKKLEHNAKIYDIENNVMYEDKDIVCSVHDENFDIEKFVTESKTLVRTKAIANIAAQTGYQGAGHHGYSSVGYRNPSPAVTQSSGSKQKKEKADEKGKDKAGATFGGDWDGRGWDYMSDNAYGYYNYES